MLIFEPIFEALNQHGARYVVVGGVAVVLQGYVRLTADLDMAVDLSPGEAQKAIDALGSIGLRPTAPVAPAEFADPITRASWINDKGMRVFSLRDHENPLRQVDIFVENPIPFEELWERSERIQVGGIPVHVASIPDLIEMKRRVGRPQDNADIEALQEIQRRRDET